MIFLVGVLSSAIIGVGVGMLVSTGTPHIPLEVKRVRRERGIILILCGLAGLFASFYFGV